MTLVTVKNSAQAHYQYINYKGTVYRQSAENKSSQHRVLHIRAVVFVLCGNFKKSPRIFI